MFSVRRNVADQALKRRVVDDEWIHNFNPEKRLLTGRSYQAVKRLFDLTCALLSAPIWVPLFIVVSVLITLDSPGAPVFFSQNRTGKDGKRFRMLKFRSMVPNAEKMKGALATLNSKGELAGPLKLESDPRITRVGRLLRKTSIDELPQIINVLKGEMSLVGPRPTSWSPESYKLWHTERLDVLPGITGLFQIYGRGGTDFDEWLKWDIRYIERRSMWFDILILLRTMKVFLRQKGAR